MPDLRIKVSELTSIGDLERAVEVERDAWGSETYRDITPSHVLRALIDHGGLVLGAFIDGRLVGISYGWFVCTGSERYFYSHTTGVLRGYRGLGIGYRLKLSQREEVLRRGFNLIKWTFDPLQKTNLYFNMRKLGAIARRYYVNYYGPLKDSINLSSESDRVLAEWYIDSRRVVKRLERLERLSAEALWRRGARTVLYASRGETPGEVYLDADEPIILVSVPDDISYLRRKAPQVANMWLSRTRDVYQRYLGRGYVLVDYAEDKRGRGYAVLVRERLERILEDDECC